MNHFFILLLVILITVYRIGFKLIESVSGSTVMFFVGVILILCSLFFSETFKFHSLTTKDCIGILMIGIATFFTDYGIVQLLQKGYSPSILNYTTAIGGLLLSLVIFIIFFGDKNSILQITGIVLGICSMFLLLR